MRFCGQCGTALARQCPQCHAEAPPGFRFCGQCGASLQAPPPQAAPAPTPRAPAAAPSIATYTPKHLADKILKSRAAVEGERRQVTVLFADVAGFTTLAERLDPEDVHRIINRCFELITAEVHRFEGTINQYTGDGVMALFGAPIAHEDSPRRAAPAALGSQHALRDRFGEVKTGRGEMVSLVGDAGIGKSRVLLEFRRALADRGEEVTWLEGQCVSFGQSIPFLPLADQLRRNFGIEEFDGEPEIIAKVEHGMRRMGELEPHTPYIRYLLSVEIGRAHV